ncbi:helix-turn-helix domain-containing protein [Caulobacter soli]|uniref:helix-turn-helix domain-containing protein n=1 Tax=Caulobacter soli TaxID=2708539 RepID=UPI0013EC0845|nr:XRE family transcriptional regulator [Caulobacter soli]
MVANEPHSMVPPASTGVAAGIRSIRRRRGLTVAALAASAQLNKGYLSRIERGEKSPSTSVLLRIARALGVQVGHLFGETATPDAVTVVRAQDQATLSAGPEDLALRLVLPVSPGRRLSALIVEPGSSDGDHRADHPGDELIYGLEGEVEVLFLDRTVRLGPGDCVHFDGHLKHQLRRRGSAPARVLVVVSRDLANSST